VKIQDESDKESNFRSLKVLWYRITSELTVLQPEERCELVNGILRSDIPNSMSSENLESILSKLDSLNNTVEWLLSMVNELKDRVDRIEHSEKFLNSSKSLTGSEPLLLLSNNEELNFTVRPNRTIVGINPGSGKYCFIIPKSQINHKLFTSEFSLSSNNKTRDIGLLVGDGKKLSVQIRLVIQDRSKTTRLNPEDLKPTERLILEYSASRYMKAKNWFLSVLDDSIVRLESGEKSRQLIRLNYLGSQQYKIIIEKGE